MLTANTLTTDIKQIILQSRETAIRAVDFQRVLMYWHIGKRIFEEEQQGQDRADYGAYLIKSLAQQLQPEFGSGFSVRQLERYRQFYRAFPIASALRTQLNWTQYKLLLSLDDADKREFYIAESVKNNWSSRQLERQIYSNLYERLLLSNDKTSVLAVVKFSLPENQKQIFASQYQLYLPTEKMLLDEMQKEIESFEQKVEEQRASYFAQRRD